MDEIMLTIPPRAEYIMVIRLTLSGIAARAGFDFETIEDLKMAISEVFNMFRLENIKGVANIKFQVAKSFLSVEIDMPASEMDKNELAEVILKTLIDEVEFTKEKNLFVIRFKKYHQGVRFDA